MLKETFWGGGGGGATKVTGVANIRAGVRSKVLGPGKKNRQFP
jgi:hypothetical protein